MSKLETRQISKTYRGRRVVDDVTVFVQQGEVVGLLGPNGAGKTTSFYMIVGLISPDSGSILVDDKDITDLPMYQRAPARHQLPAAGGQRLPQTHRGREPDGHPGDAARCAPASGARPWSGCWINWAWKPSAAAAATCSPAVSAAASRSRAPW